MHRDEGDTCYKCFHCGNMSISLHLSPDCDVDYRRKEDAICVIQYFQGFPFESKKDLTLEL